MPAKCFMPTMLVLHNDGDPSRASAHYEYLCRRHGVDVIYCAEPFVSDNTLISAIGKILKRGAAAEYSRELSVRAFRGACNLASRGFALSGLPPYGLRKVLVNAGGKRIYGPLAGDRKVQINCRKLYSNGAMMLRDLVEPGLQEYRSRG